MRRSGVWIALALGIAAVGLAVVVLPGEERETEAVSPTPGFKGYVDSRGQQVTRRLVEVADERDRETQKAVDEAGAATVPLGE